jgi:peroxiredoxin
MPEQIDFPLPLKLPLLQLKPTVFGLSTQATEYQREMVSRLRLRFEILWDSEFKLRGALRCPSSSWTECGSRNSQP